LIIAHAFGARYDLPLPLWLFVVAGGLAVFGSFLFVSRRTARAVPLADPTLDESPLGPAAGPVPATISLVLLGLLVLSGLFGSQEVPENILPTVFWLGIWIAVPVSCGLIGDWTTRWNAFAVLARLADRPRARHRILNGPALPWPAWVGSWPAVLLFFFVAGGELIYNLTATRPEVTATGLLVYALLTVFGSFLFGAGTWLRHAEVFSVLFSTWGRLGARRFGRPGRNNVLGGVDAPLTPSPSAITFLVLMLGSVTFDGLLATPTWKNTVQRLPLSLQPGTSGYIALGVAAFAVLIGLIWAFFALWAWAVRRAGHMERSTMATLTLLMPSLIPIAFAYLVAHNLDYIFVNGQLLIPLLGNPTGHHQWLPSPFNDSYVIDKKILPPALIWYLAATLIVIAHIAAVFIAHRHVDRATPDARDAQRAEWPWIVAMVLYTMTSLWLLAQPIAKEPNQVQKALPQQTQQVQTGRRAAPPRPATTRAALAAPTPGDEQHDHQQDS
jgi:hypothetical protein